jgi:hypothetical protein
VFVKECERLALAGGRKGDDDQLRDGCDDDQGDAERGVLCGVRDEAVDVKREDDENGHPGHGGGGFVLSDAVEVSAGEGDEGEGEAKIEGVWLEGVRLDTAPEAGPEEMEGVEDGEEPAVGHGGESAGCSPLSTATRGLWRTNRMPC